MSNAFRTIGLITHQGDARVLETVDKLVRHLHGRSVTTLLDEDTPQAVEQLGMPVVSRKELAERADLVIVVAGDGTFLGAARSLVDHDVPLLGINLGRLGFLADITPDEMFERVDEILAGEFDEEFRFLLHARVRRKGQWVAEMDALNEFVVHKSNIARLIQCEVEVNGRFVSRQRSDGLIVATPTGSTAYALSGGGPILHPQLDALVLVPICPHTLSNRPLVVAGDSEVTLSVRTAGASEALLTADGQSAWDIEAEDEVVVAKKQARLRLVHPKSYDYYATLRAKLHWALEL